MVYEPVKIARPGTVVRSNRASDKWAAASSGELAGQGLTLEQLSRMSSREMAGKLFDAVESLTWRAANLQPADLRKLGPASMKLWEKRGQLPGLLLEKGAHFFMKNGQESNGSQAERN
jgi:hypothetical protein